MTTARRRWKSPVAPAALGLALALGLVAWLCQGPAGAATTERLVVDRHTGLAIYGFDPVAYFTESGPLPGRPEYELSFAGAVWRFRNEGNRAAFVERPDVYSPRFGGYDVLGVARGAAVPGNPLYWVVVRQRLYLFETPATRDAFARDQGAVLPAAEAKWPDLLKTLVP